MVKAVEGGGGEEVVGKMKFGRRGRDMMEER